MGTFVDSVRFGRPSSGGGASHALAEQFRPVHRVLQCFSVRSLRAQGDQGCGKSRPRLWQECCHPWRWLRWNCSSGDDLPCPRLRAFTTFCVKTPKCQGLPIHSFKSVVTSVFASVFTCEPFVQVRVVWEIIPVPLWGEIDHTNDRKSKSDLEVCKNRPDERCFDKALRNEIPEKRA